MSDPNDENATASAPTPSKKIGRPSRYGQTIIAIIIGRMAEGESLRKICRDPEMPHRSTVHQWLSKNPSFASQYAQARELMYEHWEEECLEIADDGTTDFVIKIGRNGREYEAVDQEHIQRSRLRVDTRRWLLSKLKPKVFGDHVEVEHTGAMTVQHELSDRERMRRMALFLMEDRQAGALIEGQASEPGSEPRADHSLPSTSPLPANKDESA